MGMSSAYGRRDDASRRTVYRALDLGVNHFDTADVWLGDNERLLGGGCRGATRCSPRSSATGSRRIRRCGHVDTSRPGYTGPATARCDGSASTRSTCTTRTANPAVRSRHRRRDGELVDAGRCGGSGRRGARRRCRACGTPIAAVQVGTPCSPGRRRGDVGHLPGGWGWRWSRTPDRSRPVDRHGEIPAQLPEDDFWQAAPRFSDENLALSPYQAAGAVHEVGATRTGGLAWVLAQGDDILPIGHKGAVPRKNGGG
jgi:hypothetical protein